MDSYMEVGETKQLTSEPSTYYTVSGSWSKKGDAISITSSANRSCTISANYVGTATVTWMGYIDTTWEEMYWTIQVSSPRPIPVNNITLNKTTLSLMVRQEETLTATISPSNATDKSVTWSIDDDKVASVSQWGELKAKAEGNATITCRANDGSGITATCALKVEGEMPEPEIGSIKQVAAGWRHTMILLADGSLWATGWNEYGQLGDGTTTSCNKPKRVMTEVEYVSAGNNSTLIIKADGSLWACGDNKYGQLGDGTKTNRSTPTRIMSDVAAVSAAGSNTMILKNDGTLWGCGWNESGQLGDGTKTDRNTPTRIMSDVAAVSAGGTHTMILKNDGSLWGCGNNNFGAIANVLNSSDGDRIKTPQQMTTGVKAVSAGEYYTMFLKTNGSLWACGNGHHGVLGTGSTATVNRTPQQVMTGVKTMSTSKHSMILKNDGSLWACGWNYSGQLGDGTTTDRSTPVKVMTDVNDVSVGGLHTIIVKKDGTIWSCGLNEYGELGDGTKTDRYTPVNIEIDIIVNSVTLNKTTLSMQTGQEEVLEATVKPDNAKDKTVTWSSSNTKVATVDSNGKVTAISSGSATITCKANDESGKQATCDVTVSVLPVGISISPTSKTIEQGETFTATYTLYPLNAKATVTWSSDNEDIATVTQEGVVTGVGVGSTFINVETDNGKSAYCKLTVTNPQPTAVSIPKNATVSVGETITLTATLTPANAVTTLTWQSDDPAIATVDASGKVTGIAEGLAIIQVSTANDLTSNACKLTVSQPTGIEDVNADCNNNSHVFSLSGQRLAAPKKGFNIIGGKKVIVK